MPRRTIAVVVLAFIVSAPAFAVTRTWTGLGGDNNWSTAGNWNPVGAPVAGDSISGPSGGTPLNMVNDLPVGTVLFAVGLSDAYVVSGNAIHVSDSVGGTQATFNIPIMSEGNDVDVAAAHFAQLNPNGHRMVWHFGTIGEIAGTGEFSPATLLPSMTLTGTHSFSGTVRTGDVMIGSTIIVLDGAELPNATFSIDRELDGSGQIGPFTGIGGLKPSTDGDPIGTIATGDVTFNFHHLPELVGDFAIDIAGDNANDMIDVTGSVTIFGKPLTVALLNGYSPATGTSWVIVNNDGTDPVEGFFAIRTNGFSPGKPLEEGERFETAGRVFKISYVGGTGNDVMLTAEPNEIFPKTPTAISATAWLGGCKLLVSGHVTSTMGSATPIGTMKVRNGSDVLGTVPLDGSGRATLQIAAPRQVQAINVEFLGDAEFANSTTTANLIIADQAAPTVSIRNATANEDDGSISTTVTLLPAPCHSTSVHYTTSNGSAIAGEDYEAMSGTIEFEQGQSSRTIEVGLHADTDPESDETFTITVSGGGAANSKSATLTIANDDESFLLYSDLQYGAASGLVAAAVTPLLLDLRVPVQGDGPFPLVVVIDANRWSEPNHHSTIADFLPQHGYAVATIAFRPVSMGVFPAQLNDVRTALAWLRNNATQYRLNTLRLAVLGSGRAGGHLAALSAVSDNPPLGIDAAIVGRAATDLVAIDVNNCAGENDVAAFLGCTPSACMITATEASPSTHASRGDGPFLILETNEDCGQSQLLEAALRAANVEATLRTAPSGGNAPDWASIEVQANVLQFLEAKLKQEQRSRTRSVRH